MSKRRRVRCTKCKRKRYCVPCLTNWYPHLIEDEIATACPVCCDNCNCIACLRSSTLSKVSSPPFYINYSCDIFRILHLKCDHVVHYRQLSAWWKRRENKIKNEPPAVAQPEICEWSRSGWHAYSDGSIPCPKANNDCDHGFLELRSIHGPNCISELVRIAKELEETLNLQDAQEALDSRCFCLKPVKNADDIHNNIRKAAFREDSSDNFLYCPRAYTVLGL
ncbi:unnamed protein product [Trifolium pratense]|uniref:Uncharacterized protein n=1 Tax=Trifolium pratense TaxID=57577 RepID=A0ACB0IIU4_TRIPR|nr:unnamed protein product [Trifolium pratense]